MSFWSVVIVSTLERLRNLLPIARRHRSQIKANTRHGESPTNVANDEAARGRWEFSSTFRAYSPPHVRAQSIALLSRCVVDCAHALPVLVEHLVRPASLRRPDHRISKRR